MAASSMLVVCAQDGGCGTDDGTLQPKGTAFYRVAAGSALPALGPGLALVPDDGRPLYVQNSGGPIPGKVYPSPAPVVGVKGDKGDPGQAGKDGKDGVGLTGPAGLVPFYGATGLLTGVRCWQGTATTTAGGAWSVNYANAGFTSPPIVHAQAISSSSAGAGLMFASVTAPTATTVSGGTVLAGIGGLGGAGTVVMVRACGA